MPDPGQWGMLEDVAADYEAQVAGADLPIPDMAGGRRGGRKVTLNLPAPLSRDIHC